MSWRTSASASPARGRHAAPADEAETPSASVPPAASQREEVAIQPVMPVQPPPPAMQPPPVVQQAPVIQQAPVVQQAPVIEQPPAVPPPSAMPPPGIPSQWAYIPPPWEPTSSDDFVTASSFVHLGAPQRRRGRSGRWIVSALVLIAAGAGGAYYLHNRSSKAGSSSLPPANGNSTAASTNPATLGRELEQITLKASELKTGVSIRLAAGGDQVAGHLTFDECGYKYTSESKRLARREYKVYDGQGRWTGTGNELVAYDSANDARLALTELRRALETCPSKPVRSSIAGATPGVTFRVISRTANSIAIPVTTNETCMLSASEMGHTIYAYEIFQQHGQFLDVVYVLAAHKPDLTDTAVGKTMANLTGTRLSALPG